MNRHQSRFTAKAPSAHSNPVLSERVFGGEDSRPAAAEEGRSAVMTIRGTAIVTAAMTVLLITAAAFGWSMVVVKRVELNADKVTVSISGGSVWVIATILLAFLAVVVGSGKPKLAPFATPIYAVLEGAAIGVVSHLYGARYEGIVLQAVLTTSGVVLAMSLLYTSRWFRVTTRMWKIGIAATSGILLAYIVGMAGDMFGVDTAFWRISGPLGIAISVVVVLVAAFCLLLDFDFIERGAADNLPSYYNFVGALGLLVTVVWLYLEILRLISKVRR